MLVVCSLPRSGWPLPKRDTRHKVKEKTNIIIGDLLDGELEVWKLLLGGWRVHCGAFLRLSHLIHSLKLTGKKP